jgi:hypothetical protein
MDGTPRPVAPAPHRRRRRRRAGVECRGCRECRGLPRRHEEPLLPIPPHCWCAICGRRPVAASGEFSRVCARCRAAPVAPAAPPRASAPD